MINVEFFKLLGTFQSSENFLNVPRVLNRANLVWQVLRGSNYHQLTS